MRELIRDADQVGGKVKRRVRDDLRQVGELVAVDAYRRFSSYDENTAKHFRPTVRRTGTVVVEQRLRKTTGLRPDWGTLQMKKALIPAANDKAQELERKLRESVERIAVDFEHGGPH